MHEVDEFMLPREGLLEALMDEYFNHAALLFPYIHEPTLRTIYVELKISRFRSARRTWLALLNMVLAIASKLRTSALPVSNVSDGDDTRYYRRALKLCYRYMFCVTSVEMGAYIFRSQPPHLSL